MGSKKKIDLDVFGISLRIDGQGGAITSSLKDDSESSYYNDAIDGMESLLLALACAGVGIESPAVHEAIETAVDAISNHATEEPIRTEREQKLLHALQGMVEMWDYAADKFDWGKSWLDAEAIRLLNEKPIEAKRVLGGDKGAT